MRVKLPTILCLLLISAAGTLTTRTAAAETEPFPASWYYYGSQRPAEMKKLEGEKPPKLTVENWVGDEQDLEKLKGKVVVIDFWGTWCRPCMRAVPKNISLVEKHEKDDLVFIGVHSTNKSDTMAGAVEKHGINYPVAADVKNESAKAWQVRFWPTYAVIDRSGVLRGVGLLPDKVGEAVEILLAEEASESEEDSESSSSESSSDSDSGSASENHSDSDGQRSSPS